MLDIRVGVGFAPTERDAIAHLFVEAFAPQLRHAFASRARMLEVVSVALNPERVLVARDAADDALLGMCGWIDRDAGALQFSWRVIRGVLTRRAALRAALVLGPLARAPRHDALVLDGICVAAAARGRGVGSRLLAAASDLAHRRGLRAVRLAVVDTNPGAERLYRRHGYAPVAVGALGILAPLYGFDRFTTMERQVAA